MNLLCLDLGTKCGYAIESDGKLTSGVWDLKPSTFDSSGIRYVKFKNSLNLETVLGDIDMVLYEEVHNHRAVDAAHVYGGLRSILQTFCIENNIEYRGVGVGTIKKHATGKHNAKKDEMLRYAILKYKSVNVVDDNHADALHLLSWAKENIKAL